MKKAYLLVSLFFFSFAYSQDEEVLEVLESDFSFDENYAYYEGLNVSNDTLIYTKTLEFDKERQFTTNLKEEYNSNEFKYVDDLKKKEKEEEKVVTADSTDTSGIDLFLSFMANIFPYLMGLIVVLIILKTFVNTEAGFWKFGKTTKKSVEKLIQEDDENIDDTNFEKLLENAIQKGNFRLATRYYYLSSLKKLSQKELIKYDKDKTNTEYQFELKSEDLRKKFSYLVYLYDYVWYGEFPLDQVKFSVIENKYKSFIQVI